VHAKVLSVDGSKPARRQGGNVKRVILIGLSGTGKSSLAPLVAERLGFDWFDTDEEIQRRFGRSITDVFRDFGEPTFRAVERDVLRNACAHDRVVVATGGGVVVDEANWSLLRPEAVIIHLCASSDAIVQRLRDELERDPSAVRPLLAGGSPETKLDDLWARRRALYDRADIEVITDGRSLEDIAADIVELIQALPAGSRVPVTSIDVPGGRSDLYVGTGLLDSAAEMIGRRWPDARRAWIITDANVEFHYAGRLQATLRRAGLASEVKAVAPGEQSKSLDALGGLLDWMIQGRVNRRDIVVALGGGVVGDLAGFAAAIVLRGVGLVQIPTSLLAMVDSSVGGKTGINHVLGKNLIGAFYQPHLVIADTELLSTLPLRELRAGWAEVIKHAMIERSATGSAKAGLLARLESSTDRLWTAPASLMATLVAENIQIKVTVVRQDERETGLRRLLNYGHTLGHAMEAAEFRYIHGEAISIGLRAAARISREVGLCDDELVERQDSLLDRAGLPDRFEGSLDVVLERLSRDKKAVHDRLTWILPIAPGTVTIRQDVPLDVVVEVAKRLGAS
jgi:shikimate kinase / 3-dehydroquinate synthase